MAQTQTKSDIKSEPGSNHLRGGWYPWDPYQYRDYKRGVPVLTGFDVEIERALARIMAVEIDLPEIAWKNHLPGPPISPQGRPRARHAVYTRISHSPTERRRTS